MLCRLVQKYKAWRRRVRLRRLLKMGLVNMLVFEIPVESAIKDIIAAGMAVMLQARATGMDPKDVVIYYHAESGDLLVIPPSEEPIARYFIGDDSGYQKLVPVDVAFDHYDWRPPTTTALAPTYNQGRPAQAY
jgi:hypothetical protein